MFEKAKGATRAYNKKLQLDPTIMCMMYINDIIHISLQTNISKLMSVERSAMYPRSTFMNCGCGQKSTNLVKGFTGLIWPASQLAYSASIIDTIDYVTYSIYDSMHASQINELTLLSMHACNATTCSKRTQLQSRKKEKGGSGQPDPPFPFFLYARAREGYLT